MAALNDSFYAECESNEFFETALEEYLTELSIEEADEVRELSRVTKKVLTPTDVAADPCEDRDIHLTLPQECAKEYFQSSTPKRINQCIRTEAHPMLIMRLNDFGDISGEDDDEDDSGGVRKPSAEPELPRLSLIIREHRRQLILSPFSENLRSAILRKDSARKRRQRTEMRKKAQRASLRV